MSDDVFLKIIDQIKRLNGDDHIRICLYLNNEPLLDPLLFKRAQFIKKVFQSVEIEISTNCLLLPKYADQIIENFDNIILSLQGWDLKSYNLIHRLNITEDYFNKIKKEYDRIKELSASGKNIVAKHWDSRRVGTNIEDVDSWYEMNYSKAGFFSNNKILIKKLDGCAKQKHRFFNFLHDGTMALCCMDCIREVVLGNIKHQSLLEIINSDLYKNIMQKIEGQIKSEFDFICKRCELALGVKNESISNNRECSEIFRQ
jgi:MoaA/NifB/PqqE/SkfB family radical SAM enzyme